MRALPHQRSLLPPQDVDPATDGLVDVQHLKHLVGFTVRSIWRHRLLFTTLFSIIMVLAVVAYVVTPRQYLVQTRLFAQRNFVMPNLNNPRRTVPAEADAPTRMALETVMKRENLLAMIKSTGLVAEWDKTRAPILKLKDRLVNLIAGQRSEGELIEALAGTLERRLWVAADEGTVTIGVLWADPDMAYKIVNTAQENFINERHTSEVSAIQESIKILEGRAASVNTMVTEGHAELQRNLPNPVLPAAARRNPATQDRITSLQVALASRRLAIADLEAYQRRRLQELQTRLAEQRNTYGPRHPALSATEQSIADASRESPQLVELREEERRTIADLRALGADPNAAPGTRDDNLDQTLARAAVASMIQQRNDSVRLERESYIRARLQISQNEYEDLLQRLQAARIELETARAAFKYRYGVITPAQVPKRPVTPNPIVFLAGGIALAGMIAFFGVLAVDIGGGRVLESWQVERQLGLRVLREVTAQ